MTGGGHARKTASIAEADVMGGELRLLAAGERAKLNLRLHALWRMCTCHNVTCV